MLITLPYLSTWFRARFGRNERGASLVEYALLVALIAVVAILALQLIGRETGEQLNSVGSSLDQSPEGPSTGG
jgi:pilus assembly protein Flp/PilA